MAHPKVNFEPAFPDPEDELPLMRASAPRFYRCPTGHSLPHRTITGRCTPLDCCDQGEKKKRKKGATLGPYEHEQALLPKGLEGKALSKKRAARDVAHAEVIRAQAEEALQMQRLAGIQMARQGLHPLPDLPEPPSLKELGAKAYVRQRLDDIAPYALEKRIFDMVYHPGERGVVAAKELLSRAGFGENQAQTPDFRGPVRVSVVVGTKLPFDEQVTINEQKEVVGERLLRRGDGGRQDAAAIARGAGEQGSARGEGGLAGPGLGAEVGNRADSTLSREGGDQANAGGSPRKKDGGGDNETHPTPNQSLDERAQEIAAGALAAWRSGKASSGG